jgi:hypothetical protein
MATQKSMAKTPATDKSRKESQRDRREHGKGQNISTKNPVARPEEQSQLQRGRRKTPLSR